MAFVGWDCRVHCNHEYMILPSGLQTCTIHFGHGKCAYFASVVTGQAVTHLSGKQCDNKMKTTSCLQGKEHLLVKP